MLKKDSKTPLDVFLVTHCSYLSLSAPFLPKYFSKGGFTKGPIIFSRGKSKISEGLIQEETMYYSKSSKIPTPKIPLI